MMLQIHQKYIITTLVHFFLCSLDMDPIFFSFPYNHTLLLIYVYDLEQSTLFLTLTCILKSFWPNLLYVQNVKKIGKSKNMWIKAKLWSYVPCLSILFLFLAFYFCSLATVHFGFCMISCMLASGLSISSQFYLSYKHFVLIIAVDVSLHYNPYYFYL